MKTLARSSALILATLVAVSFTVCAQANELAARGGQSAGFVIHDAAQVERDFCRWEDGRLYLLLPGGARYELVPTTADAAITNAGDGSFHPFDASEVRATLEAVRYPLARIAADIYVLPYPRRSGLESAAGPGLILLSPGVRDLSVEHQHAELTHELGHVVQYALLADNNETGWQRYRALRGIGDESAYSADAVHANRPHEIFAEDFRALFGDALANYSGTIENAALAHPGSVVGLASFFSDLADQSLASHVRVIAGNAHASRGAVRFGRSGSQLVALDVFDVSGRRIATVSPTAATSGVEWAWDGRDRHGRAVQSAVVFARARDGQGGIARVTRLQ